MTTDVKSFNVAAVYSDAARQIVHRFNALAVYLPLSAATYVQRLNFVAVYKPEGVAPTTTTKPQVIFFM